MLDSIPITLYPSVSGTNILKMTFRYKNSEECEYCLNPGVVGKDFDDLDKIKISVSFTHSRTFDDYAYNKKMRSKVVLGLKKILEKT